MAFDAREVSDQEGAPVVLYHFQHGPASYRYAHADRVVSVLGSAWTGAALDHEGFQSSGDASREQFSVKCAASLPVAALYAQAAPSQPVKLTVRRWHEGDADAAVVWVGYVVECKRPTDAEAVLVCQSVAASFNRAGLRLGWQRSCPHALYDSECRADKALHAVAATVADLSPIAVVAAAFGGFADGHFRGGWVEWTTDTGATERRAVEHHFGTACALLGGTQGLALDQEVAAYPGCAHTLEECHAKFNNALNFGGIKLLPGRSPFDGNLVF